MSAPEDPVATRRARIHRGVRAAKAAGYTVLLVSIVLFVVTAVTDFPDLLVAGTIGSLVAAAVILPVPIVLGYGLRAAEREERRTGAQAGGAGPADRR